jgi:putative membrane protein
MRKTTMGSAASLAAAGVLLMAPGAFAQGHAGDDRRAAVQQTEPRSQEHTSSADAKLSKAERKFLSKAAQSGMAEVQLGKLALDKASSEAVKRIGETLVEHHSSANGEVQQIAAAAGVTLPHEAGGKHKSAVKRLSKLSGEEFDREFLRYQLRHHREDFRQFEEAATKTENPEVKEFASSTLPTLREHQAMIGQAAKAAGVEDLAEETADRLRDQDQRQSDPSWDYPRHPGDPSQDPRQRPHDPTRDPQQRPFPGTTPPIVPR